MKLIDVLRMALGNLRRNRMRTVLTVSGVVVGIGAIVFLVSLGFGVQNLMVSKVANLEALTVITVRPGNKEDTKITEDTVKKFKSFGEVTVVSPLLSYPAQINDGSASSETIINGVIPEYFDLEDIKVDHGSKFSGNEAKEAIVSAASLKSLNQTNPDTVLGKEFNFRVIQLDDSGNIKKGHENDVVKLKIVGMTNEDKTKYAYVPLEIIKKMDGANYSSIKVRTAQRKQVASVRKAIESMGYPTTSVKDTVDQIDKAFVIIRSILGGFGMVALFVAAIGIFNTMTISLLERTHEIGIMKAIGGRNGDVAKIFIAEAAVIGIMGGFLGVASGWFLGFAINAFINFLATSVGGEANTIFYVPLDFVGLVIAFSFIVSTAAGILPARRASKLNPLEALRYE
jgi:putative ABC transport system permease protein